MTQLPPVAPESLVYHPNLPEFVRQLAARQAPGSAAQQDLHAAADELIARRRLASPAENEAVAVVADNARLRTAIRGFVHQLQRGPLTDRRTAVHVLMKTLVDVPAYGSSRVFISAEITGHTRAQVEAAIAAQLDLAFPRSVPVP